MNLSEQIEYMEKEVEWNNRHLTMGGFLARYEASKAILESLLKLQVVETDKIFVICPRAQLEDLLLYTDTAAKILKENGI